MVDQNQNNLMAACSRTRAHFSEYVDNTLSARDVWDVEKHLAECNACSEQLQLTQRTVEALHSAESYDTSDFFMSSLHARLDEVGPVRDRTPMTMVSDLFASMSNAFRKRLMPTVSLGLATCSVVVLMFALKPTVNPAPQVPIAMDKVSQDALDRHVAVTASNPFDDPVAAKLEADTSESLVKPGSDTVLQ